MNKEIEALLDQLLYLCGTSDDMLGVVVEYLGIGGGFDEWP